MAPIGEKSTGQFLMDDKKEDEEGQNIWSTILKQVQASLPNKLPSHKILLVLGDNESGKTTLIAKLQGNEDPKKGSGLEYHYLFVRDEYRDDHTRLGVWVLDGDPWHRNLLKYVLNEETIGNTTVLLSASMTSPWDIMESLESWATVLEEHIDRMRLPPEVLEQQRQRTFKRFQDYIEPGDEIEGVTSPLRRTSGLGDDEAALPLGEHTLTHNIGLDIIVVVTKTDYMSTLEKEHDYRDEHFDFIQQAIRKFCLRYGASLFYTSVKEDKNCDVLYKYLVHRIYGFPFKTPALVVEKDAVFIPSGWDNDKKIAILYENIHSMKPDENFSDVISKPPIMRKPLRGDPEVMSEDDQLFLSRQQGLLNQQAPSPGGRPEPSARTPAVGVQKTGGRSSGPHATPTPAKKETDFSKMTQQPDCNKEGVLQNFFNSLLNRKTAVGATPPGRSPDKSLVRSDPAAELDRMTRSIKNKVPATNSQQSPSSPTPSAEDATSSSYHT